MKTEVLQMKVSIIQMNSISDKAANSRPPRR